MGQNPLYGGVPVIAAEATRIREWLERLPSDELKHAKRELQRELDRREGRDKFRLPDHVQRIIDT